METFLLTLESPPNSGRTAGSISGVEGDGEEPLFTLPPPHLESADGSRVLASELQLSHQGSTQWQTADLAPTTSAGDLWVTCPAAPARLQPKSPAQAAHRGHSHIWPLLQDWVRCGHHLIHRNKHRKSEREECALNERTKQNGLIVTGLERMH